jgi:lipoprotein-releasing system permease protein
VVGSGWRFCASIARRFLTGGQSRLLAGTARAAIASIAIGVTAMVVGMALMSGYRHDLEHRLLAGSAAVGVFPSGLVDPATEPHAVAVLGAIPGVAAVGRVVYGQGSVAAEQGGEGLDVTLRGIDSGGADLSGRPRHLAAGDPPEIVPGSELARRLGVAAGDTVRLTVLEASYSRPRFRYRSVRVGEPFESGYFEFDRSWALVDRGLLEELTGLAGTFELTLEEPAAADRVAGEARRLLGTDYEVRNFRDANRELFEALEWQQVLLFLVLGLIVVVSTFNVASTLVVLVRERMRELGVLAAMGAAPRDLGRVFLVYGGLVGAIGVSLGLGVGSLAAWVLDEFQLIRLGSGLSSVYFLSSVPFRLRWTDLGAIGLFSLAVTLASCLLPARRATRRDPAAALRYQ